MARILRASNGTVLHQAIDAERPLEPGEARLRSVASTISHGTELALVSGRSAFAGKHFDAILRVFVPDAAANDTSPQRELGYEMVSRVLEVGSAVTNIAPGDLVHTGTPHQDQTIVDLAELETYGYPLTPLPARVGYEPALFISLGSVALQAIHDARIKLGDRVLVCGLGVIGLLVVQMAKLNGASVVLASDPSPSRRTLAASFGAEVLDTASFEAAGGLGVAVKRRLGRAGVDVALEASGAYAGLHACIAAVGVGGRVVSVGFYQGGGQALRLGEEWHHNRLEMISSMGVWQCPHRDYPLWDRQRLTDLSRNLLYDGSLRTDRLLTHTFSFDDAAQAYDLIKAQPEQALKVALVYGPQSAP